MTVPSDLAIIRQKVRNVTATTSAVQLSDSEIDFYINTYLVFDFPEHLRLKSLHRNYTFFTNPNVDTYDFPVEQYISTQKPVYCDGYQVEYYQEQEFFYSLWPKLNFEQQVGTGDGVTTNPTLSALTNIPALRKSVHLSATIGGENVSFLDNGEGVFLSEPFTIINISNAASAVVTLNTTNHPFTIGSTIFISNVYGMTSINGGSYTVTNVAGALITINVNSSGYNTYEAGGEMTLQQGTINYTSGAITMDWGTAPDNATTIYSGYIPYVASRPRTVLFFNNQFIFRPVPNRSYRIETEVFQVPTALLASSQSPELRQWWQMIALGAALKIFEDTQNMDDYRDVLPLYKQQEVLANRRTIKQQTSQRVATPFTEGPRRPYGLFYDIYGGF